MSFSLILVMIGTQRYFFATGPQLAFWEIEYFVSESVVSETSFWGLKLQTRR